MRPIAGKRANKGKYRDSKHYREWKGKKPAASNHTPAASKAVKSAPKAASYGGSTGGTSWSKQGRCIALHWQSPFDLGDGEVIFASAFADRPKVATLQEASDMRPDVGVYWDEDWAMRARILTTPGIEIPGLTDTRAMVLFEWQDYGTPRSMTEFDTIIRWVYEQVQAGKIVDTGCFAAHGRTGTALAALLILKGVEARQAIAAVRARHCKSAIEVFTQEEWLYDYDEMVNGRERPKRKPRRKRLPPVTGTMTHDAYGRRLDAPDRDAHDKAIAETVLNEMGSEEAYEEWLSVNARVTDDVVSEDWCDWCDLPTTLCNCDPGWKRVSGIGWTNDPDRNDGCSQPPCFSPESCDASVGDCWARQVTEVVVDG